MSNRRLFIFITVWSLLIFCEVPVFVIYGLFEGPQVWHVVNLFSMLVTVVVGVFVVRKRRLAKMKSDDLLAKKFSYRFLVLLLVFVVQATLLYYRYGFFAWQYYRIFYLLRPDAVPL